jgi:ATP-dependent DNA helicase RecQ
MTQYLPQTLTELKKVSGFGDAKIKKYGLGFLDIILTYAEERGLASTINRKEPKKDKKERTGPAKKKGETFLETLKLYKAGIAIPEIATARGLAVGTIESHLGRFVQSGELKMEQLVSKEKIELIESALADYHESSITPLKNKLGSDVSFGEIRLVMASLGKSLARSSNE